ncbi:MAG: ABC transporter substrate-binding protein [Spirochaetales bacterium]|nr:ABC transporter substrate-binding protein [Spirochaetales bacterium]
MKKVLNVLLTLSLLLLLFSCGSEVEESKTLNRFVLGKLAPFDPAQVGDKYTHQVLGDMYENLYEYKYTTDTYQLEPVIAESMPEVSDDGLVYTIKLRKDAYFYDPLGEVFPEKKGRPVNAHDFVLSVKRLADPENEAGGWWLYEGRIAGLDEWAEAGADYSAEVEGFKALDDYTIQMTLNAPYPQILYTLAMSYTFPVAQEVIDFYGPEEFANYPVGTGAYYYDHMESIPGSQHVLLANPTWHGKTFPAVSEAGPLVTEKLGADVLAEYAGKELPFCDRVVWYIIEESSVQWLKFLNGELDYSSIPKDNFDSTVVNGTLSQEMIDKGITLDINGSLDVTYTFFNMELPIFRDNPKLRQAMSLGYNNEKVQEIFYNFRCLGAQTLLPPGLGGYEPDYVNPYARYDVEEAKKLLAEAGFPNGEGLPTFKFQMYSNTSTTHKQMVEFFIENMAEIGITVEAVPGDWPTFLEAIDNHNIEIGGMAWGADYPDAQNFLQLNYGPNFAPGPNSANYSNPAFDALYDKGAFMQQSPERDKIYAEAAQMAAEDVPWIMGVHRLAYALKQPWLKTRVYRDIGHGYSKYLDVDAEERAAQAGK